MHGVVFGIKVMLEKLNNELTHSTTCLFTIVHMHGEIGKSNTLGHTFAIGHMSHIALLLDSNKVKGHNCNMLPRGMVSHGNIEIDFIVYLYICAYIKL